MPFLSVLRAPATRVPGAQAVASREEVRRHSAGLRPFADRLSVLTREAGAARMLALPSALHAADGGVSLQGGPVLRSAAVNRSGMACAMPGPEPARFFAP